MNDITHLVQTSYDSVAAAYVENLYQELAGKPLDRHLLHRFAEEVREQGRVADVGCGPGHVTRYLHELGVPITGFDLSPEMVRWAGNLNPEVTFQVGDFRSLDFPDASFAGIIAFYSVIHLEAGELESAFREFRRLLSPSGVLLLAFHIGSETVHREELWGQAVCLDFRFLMPSQVTASLIASSLRVIEAVEREPYAGVEYPSRRCYLLARAV